MILVVLILDLDFVLSRCAFLAVKISPAHMRNCSNGKDFVLQLQNPALAVILGHGKGLRSPS